MAYTVAFTPDAEAQLVEMYVYIAAEASPEIAARFIEGIVTYCESLSTFPARGNRRDDIRPGLRITSYRKRVAIAFYMDEDRSISSESSTAVRIMRRPCSKKNEKVREISRRGQLWPLLLLCPGNMPCGGDAPRSLKWRLAKKIVQQLVAQFRHGVGMPDKSSKGSATPAID